MAIRCSTCCRRDCWESGRFLARQQPGRTSGQSRSMNDIGRPATKSCQRTTTGCWDISTRTAIRDDAQGRLIGAVMIAAIYARKSTDQNGIPDEQKSVARQVDHARAYATRKGWTVDDAHVYVDDGISGAEFATRPGFLRLMNTLKPRAPFQFLIMSEESRLGREAIETAYALKQLVTAGVRVFFYLEDRERTLDSPTDKVMLSLTAFADELEREKARQRTYDAMSRKAKAGHVTGGRLFGYDNIDVCDVTGHRSHVTRQINETEAAIVHRIFALSIEGYG